MLMQFPAYARGLSLHNPGKALFMIALLSFAAVAVADDSEIDNLRSNIRSLLPGNMTLESVEPSPMEGVYIVVAGTQTLYVYSKDDLVMIGDVYDTVRRVNLGEERRNKEMAAAIASLPEDEIIYMGEPLPRQVTVFTDTDCVYCQRFHQTVPELQERGMQVRYLMFPRAGVGSASYHEAVSVWCAEDQAEAMTIAKTGGQVEQTTCENPVAGQYELGQRIGVRGTPTMILDNGKVIPGFLTPDQLMAEAETPPGSPE